MHRSRFLCLVLPLLAFGLLGNGSCEQTLPVGGARADGSGPWDPLGGIGSGGPDSDPGSGGDAGSGGGADGSGGAGSDGGSGSGSDGGAGNGSGGSAFAVSPEEAACGIVAELACGQFVTMNTATDPRATRELATYGDAVGLFDGPELGFRVTLPLDAQVGLRDAVPMDVDHDIFLLPRDNGPCDQENYAQRGFNSFRAERAGTYSVLVDGYDGDAGPFTLYVDCGSGAEEQLVVPDAPTGAGSCAGGGDVCVDDLPFYDSGDTQTATRRAFDTYSCSGADESGPEIVYEVPAPQGGYLSARVTDGDGVDVDLHILSSLDAAACLSRGDRSVDAHVGPGIYYVVADTYNGDDNAGPFEVAIGLTTPSVGSCAMESGTLNRISGGALAMPATGAVVKEAHLVTPEDGFGSAWPNAARDQLDEHYLDSEGLTGFVMARTEAWAPYGEGGSMWGQGSTVKPPMEAEAWYVNMLWSSSSRPAPGTRMVVQANGRSVVVAAGYETGPSSSYGIAGTTEEVHQYLGTTHQSTMTLGFAVDQSLPYGPIACN